MPLKPISAIRDVYKRQVMGLSSRQLDTALRISFCGINTEKEAYEFIQILREGLSSLHGLS